LLGASRSISKSWRSAKTYSFWAMMMAIHCLIGITENFGGSKGLVQLDVPSPSLGKDGDPLEVCGKPWTSSISVRIPLPSAQTDGQANVKGHCTD
jgi:hypothetical protein